jgi:acetyl esterase/lipase
MRAELDRRGVLAMGVAGMMGIQTPPPGTGQAPQGLPDPAETIDLWPGPPPGAPSPLPTELTVTRGHDPRFTDRAVTGVARPRMVVFRPAPGTANGAAAVAFPGGGYARLAVDKEGYEIARWLSARGWTVFVLFYRLPGEGWVTQADVPLQDAQRAMRLVRARAGRYGIDPQRIGAIGFSAGGHLCADLITRWDAPVYSAVDAADTGSARPRIAAGLYPVVTMTDNLAHTGSRANLIGHHPSPALVAAHSPEQHVRADTPPTFLCAAEDDATVPVGNTLLLRAALKAAGVPVETHLFEAGGHGFGLRGVAGKPAAAWPDLFLAWSRTHGMLG